MTWDALATYHTDPWTCGTAKFNQRLAAALGIPCVSCEDARGYARVLWSLKPDEYTVPPSPLLPYDLLLHGAPKPTDLPMVKHARRVFAANHAIADTLSRLDIPSRLVPIPPLLDETHDPIRLLSFGMAHKLTRHHYAHVRDLLGDRPYEVELSVLVHEGQPWGGLLQRAHDSMREVFGDRARVQGSLSDGALRQRLRSATYALLFYPGGVRSNNTTMWAALQEGAHLITNLDPWSPAALTHGVNCYDVTRLTRWPDHPPCACHIPTLAQTVEVLCEP